MNTKLKGSILVLVLLPSVAMANAWVNLDLSGGQKLASTGTNAGLVYGLGLSAISPAGLSLSAAYQYGAINLVSGASNQALSQGTLLLNYYLTPGRPISPYIGYGLNFASLNGNAAQGTRAVAGLLMKMQGDMAIKIEGAYDWLDNVGGSNLTGWTGTGALVFNLSGPKEEPREERREERMEERRPDMPPPPRGDRDHDGVPNRLDRAPGNPYRN